MCIITLIMGCVVWICYCQYVLHFVSSKWEYNVFLLFSLFKKYFLFGKTRLTKHLCACSHALCSTSQLDIELNIYGEAGRN